MKESNVVRRILVASAIFVLGIPAIASATPHINETGDTVVRVSYADLNLSTQTGLTALYRRLKSASSRVCGPQHSYRSAGSLQQLKFNRECYDNLLSRLVAKVHNPELDEIHAG